MRPVVVLTIAVLFGLGIANLRAQSWQMPADSQRCPSKWGAGDQRGSGNWMKPETVLRAAKLIRTGEVFDLAQVLSPDPKELFLNAGRVYNIYTKPSLPVPNTRTGNEELVVTDEHCSDAIRELLYGGGELTRQLLGFDGGEKKQARSSFRKALKTFLLDE